MQTNFIHTFITKLFIITQKIIPQHSLSRLMGTAANCEYIWFKNLFIRLFCKLYPINLAEAEFSAPQQFKNFNAFFTRRLKPNARPLPQSNHGILSPADGLLMDYGKVQNSQTFTIKGQKYTLEGLLAGYTQHNFNNSAFAVIYLAPYHYHRVHMPVTGTLSDMFHIPGKLFSVNPKITDTLPVFAQNERVMCLFDTDIGKISIILVGAMIVGSISTPWAGIVAPSSQRITQIHYGQHNRSTVKLSQGEEMGHFQMGSTVIMLIDNPNLKWKPPHNASKEILMGSLLADYPITTS